MATVYSLVCWGGKDGFTPTISIANPCVVTITNHGLKDGSGVVFTTTGALPTGITSGVTYYSHSTGANTFNLYDTSTNAIAGGTTGRVTTSGSQSGTHTAIGVYWLGLTTAQKLRYGAAGSERAYGGIQLWKTARLAAGVSSYDSEICEIGEAFTEYVTTSASFTVNLGAASTLITTRVDGVRSSGWHGGVIGNGFILRKVVSTNENIALGYPNTILDGITTTTQYQAHGIALSALFCEARNNICIGYSNYYTGISSGVQAQKIINNICIGFSIGINLSGSQLSRGCILYNNLVTKCTNGIMSSSSPSPDIVALNNIAIGNTTNWPTTYIPTFLQASKNVGETGNSPWNLSPGVSLAMATTDFTDWTNNDFTPSNASSPQVNTGVTPYDGYEFDIKDKIRPNYEPSTHPDEVWDVGPFEFDHGNGMAPATLTVTNLTSGSRVKVERADTLELLATETESGGSVVLSVGYSGNVIVTVRAASSAPFYQQWQTTINFPTTNNIIAEQELD